MDEQKGLNKLRIAFMFYDGAHAIGAGPMISSMRMVMELKKRGHDVLALILAHQGESAAKNPLTEKGVVCRVKAIPAYRQNLMRWILIQLKAFEPDVFVPNNCFSGLFAAKWVKKAGIPTVATHRSDDELNWLIAQHFGAGIEWKTSGLVCVSRYLFDETCKIASNNFEAKVIPSGVPVPVMRANQEEIKLRVVYAGRLVQRQKKIHDVLDVFIRLVNRFDRVECAFLGEGPEKKALMDRVASAGLLKKIKFYGVLIGDKYQETLIGKHVIVLLSDYEGTPGSIMDGMACGLIPICKRYNGIDDLVVNGKTGFVVESKDDVEAVVSRLLEDMAVRKDISKNARRHIEKYYSISKAAALWESFFYELIEKQPKKAGPIHIPWRFSGKYPSGFTGYEPPFQFKQIFSPGRWLRKIQSVFTP